MAEHRIQENAKASLTDMWDKRMDLEDKITQTHNKYETLNSAFQRLGLGMTILEEKGGSSAGGSVLWICGGSGGGISGGGKGPLQPAAAFIPSRLVLK